MPIRPASCPSGGEYWSCLHRHHEAIARVQLGWEGYPGHWCRARSWPHDSKGTCRSWSNWWVLSSSSLLFGSIRVRQLTVCIVYGLDRQDEPSAYFHEVKRLASEEYGTSLEYKKIDVREVPELNEIVGAIADKHGRLDGLLHAAGIQQETPALEYTADDARRMMDVNLVGSLMTAQAAARQMIKYKNAGSIALIASMSGTIANKGLICCAYNSSKAAVIQLARNLAMEWGPHGIRVNSISPGYIVTEMVEKLFVTHPERREQWASQNPLGRLSKPEEYRGAAVFLLSDASSFMTGSDLRMDGGHAAW